MASLAELLLRHSASERTYLACGEARLSYARACALVVRQARALAALGCGGEHVAILMRNDAPSVLAYWSLALAGATPVVLDGNAPAAQVAPLAAAADCAWIAGTRAAEVAALAATGALDL